MAVVKWSAPSAESSNLAGAALNGLANGSNSTLIGYDNSTNRDLYARVTIELGSCTPSGAASVSLRYVGRRAGSAEDITTSLETYVAALTTTTSTKRVVFEMVRLYPFSDGFVITNNAGVSFPSSGNAVYVQPFGEEVA